MLPSTLQNGTKTFADLRTTLDTLDVLVNESKPATKRLAPFLAQLRPLIRDADPTIRDLRNLIRTPGANNDLIELLTKQPKLTSLAKADFPNTIKALQKGQPVISYIRPYAPDFTGWIMRFAEVASPYDANGHYARVEPVFNAFQYTRNSNGSFLTAIPTSDRLNGLQTKKGSRCPGAATQPAPDGSNPFLDLGQLTPGLRPDLGAPRPMRRMIGIALLLIALPVMLVFGVAARGGDGGSGYKVRAIFDFVRLVPGEDVKIAGAKVGKVDSLDVTPDKKAAVVLDIQKSGFAPFHTDAHCTIRPQSLIGETFADCIPGSTSAPDLPTIPDGQKGAGEHLLPVQNTSSPVDVDQINDIYREPIGQRLAIVINEFGAGLAGRGQDLNVVIHRANPALRETDKVLAVLASQNRTLADLAKNSDQVLGPLAAKRRSSPASSPRPTRPTRPPRRCAATSRRRSSASRPSCASCARR